MGAREPGPAWDQFLGSVERDLADLHRRFEHLYDRRRERRTPSARPADPLAPARARAPAAPDVGGALRERDKVTNYRVFPRRENASARIFRPQSPERIARRGEQKTVPVVLGRLLLADAE